MKGGWSQWGLSKNAKYHYFYETESGYHPSMCQLFGMVDGLGGDIDYADPSQKQKCKLCVKALQKCSDTLTEGEK